MRSFFDALWKYISLTCIFSLSSSSHGCNSQFLVYQFSIMNAHSRSNKEMSIINLFDTSDLFFNVINKATNLLSPGVV